LIRLPDVYNRLQAATKCVTLGTCLILVGVMLITHSPAAAVKALICAVFIVITSPTGAHALARGSHVAGVKLWEKSVVDRYAEDNEAGLGSKEDPAS
ncbi:MAG: monovalent cation/H(+) antiporter subunit G, partial [Verrucomicrobia bacterium]|nr:monovalent cation/H(+) antiporter subunit G [Verrucomicrobiota bacterium]